MRLHVTFQQNGAFHLTLSAVTVVTEHNKDLAGLKRLGRGFLSGQTAEHSALVNRINPDQLSDVSQHGTPGHNAPSLNEKVRRLVGTGCLLAAAQHVTICTPWTAGWP